MRSTSKTKPTLPKKMSHTLNHFWWSHTEIPNNRTDVKIVLRNELVINVGDRRRDWTSTGSASRVYKSKCCSTRRSNDLSAVLWHWLFLCCLIIIHTTFDDISKYILYNPVCGNIWASMIIWIILVQRSIKWLKRRFLAVDVRWITAQERKKESRCDQTPLQRLLVKPWWLSPPP